MRSRALFASSAALVVVACSGVTTSVDSSPAGAQAGDAGDRADGGADARADHHVQGGDGASSSSCVSDPTPPTSDATTIVHFVLTNSSATPRYVLSDANHCAPFAIDGERTSVPYSCGCECPPPSDSLSFKAIAPGASVTLDWGAMRTVLYESRDTCGVWGQPDLCASYTFGAGQALSPGDYVARFVVAQTVPVSDPDAGYPTGPCYGSPDGGYRCSVGRPLVDGACDPSAAGVTTEMTSASFTVPQSGDVTVAVAIP